jgi:hypothetical protein
MMIIDITKATVNYRWFNTFIVTEKARWAKVVKDAGVKAD